MFEFLRRRKHARIAAQPFPEAFSALLDAQVPAVRALAPEERAKLEGLIQIFLEEKTFEGMDGLVVDDAMRISIAAQACLLLLGMEEPDVYPDLVRIFVHPRAYGAVREHVEGLVVQENEEVRLGESSASGVVVLAWDAVRRGARDTHDGHNVVYHELAHQLDQHFGDADGAPELPRGMGYGPWAAAMSKEFERLEAARDVGRRTLLDTYGATNPAEFFAVATEAFFEKPVQMKARKPELYAQLAAFYRQDPAARSV